MTNSQARLRERWVLRWTTRRFLAISMVATNLDLDSSCSNSIWPMDL